MALTAPVTNISNLDAFLAKVATLVNALDSKALPADGWALTDLEASVSEIIGDKRDLIDIVTKWDSAADSFAQWENLTAQQKAAIDDLKAQVESLAGSADEFEDILLWWDANYQTIFDVKEHTEVIHGDMESIHASEQAVTQMKADVTSLKADVTTLKDQSQTAADTATTKAAEASASADDSDSRATDSANSAAAALTSETNAAASADTADSRATDAKAHMDASWDNRSAAIEAKNDAVAARTGAEAAATNSDASADASEASALRAEEAALLADGTATAAVTERVDELLSGAPEAYDTLKEIADKLAAQDGVDAALVQQISAKADKTKLAEGLSTKADKTELTEGLGTKADADHAHEVADVTGLQAELDGKVDTTSTGARLYGTTAGGSQTLVQYSSSADRLTVPYRTTSGTVRVGEPVDDSDAATKAYVDSNSGTSDKITHTYEGTTLPLSGVLDALIDTPAHSVVDTLPSNAADFPNTIFYVKE